MTEKKIWNNLRNGDSAALESIYRTHVSQLYDYGKKITRDQQTIQDCIQELFIDLWNKRESLSEIDHIKPYLFVSLKRKIFHSIKKIRKLTDNEVQESHFDVQLSIEEIIMEVELSQERKEKLAKAFMLLSDRQKEILYLKYYSDMDYDQISQIMELNYQSARNLVSRAIKKLSKHINIIKTILFGWIYI